MARRSPRKVVWQELDELMKELDVPVAKLARQCGVSRASVYGWLQGRQRPTYDRLQEVARVLSQGDDESNVAAKLLS